MNGRACSVFLSIIMVLAFSGAVLAGEQQAGAGDKDGWSLSDVEEKWFHTRVNIFYQKPRKIYSTNLHKGKTLPAGSKVKITFAAGREIEFEDGKGQTFILILRKKHTVEEMTLREYFDQHFSSEDPLRKDGPYAGFTDSEQWNIKNGTIEKGMSRPAVLMAYGYPPSHETPSLKDDKWTYWAGSLRARPIHVYFKDGRVYRIEQEGKPYQ
jgi:hypothetical protein